VTRTENAKWFGAKGWRREEMKHAVKQGDDTDLNVYSTKAAGYLGWAYSTGGRREFTGWIAHLFAIVGHLDRQD